MNGILVDPSLCCRTILDCCKCQNAFVLHLYLHNYARGVSSTPRIGCGHRLGMRTKLTNKKEPLIQTFEHSKEGMIGLSGNILMVLKAQLLSSCSGAHSAAMRAVTSQICTQPILSTIDMYIRNPADYS